MPALGALSMLGRKSKKDKEKEAEEYRLITNGTVRQNTLNNHL